MHEDHQPETPKRRPLTPELREAYRRLGMTEEEMRMARSGDWIQILDVLMPQLLPRLVLCRRGPCRRRKACVPRSENDIGACLVVLENRCKLYRRAQGKITPWGSCPEALAQFEAETRDLQRELAEAELAVWDGAGPPTAAERQAGS